LTSLLVFGLAAAAVALVLLTASHPRWSSGASSIVWPASDINVVSGQAQVDDGRLIVRQSGPDGRFIVTLPAFSLDAGDYGAIDIRIEGLSENQTVAVLWRNGAENQRTYSKQADAINATLLRVRLANDPNWTGSISGLGLAISGPVRKPLPLAIDSIRAVTVSASGRAADTVRNWLAFEKWNGQSINLVLLGADTQAISLPLFVGATTLIALGAWIFFAGRRRPRRALLARAIAIVAAGWLVLDLRWMLNFEQQAELTAKTFAGKSWREKQLAADDQELYRFIERARLAIAQRPGRVFFTSDFAYFRARAGYHLLPLNTVANVYHRELYDPVYLHPGDYICFFARGGVTYDATNQLLSWDGRPPVHVERVGLQGFGALYRVIA
jgi:hypothetical protein